MPAPIEQLLSRTVYETDGTTTVWDFSFASGYLADGHVKAYTETPEGLRTEVTVTSGMLIGEFQLQITPALVDGLVLTIYRDTPKDAPLVDFTDGSGLSEVALDVTAKQAVFVAAEAVDQINSTDLAGASEAAEAAGLAAAAAQASADDAEAALVSLAEAVADAEAAQAGAEAAETAAQGYAASINPVNFATAAQGIKADTALQPATSGATGLAVLAAATSAAARATLGSAEVGINSSITQLTSLASVNGGQLAGFRNKVINGGMQVWQLATTSAIFAGLNVPQILSTTGGYAGLDRFFAYTSGANGTLVRVAGPTTGTLRARLDGAFGVTAMGFGHRIEALNAVTLAGGTATLSAKLRNPLLPTVTWTASYANTTDLFGTISVPTKTLIATGSFTVSATEATYSASFSVPAAAATGIEIVFSVGAQTSAGLTVGDVQLEAGPVATPFEWRSAATELQLCQRYRTVNTPGNASPDCEMVLGVANSATQAMFVRPFPVQMQRREVSFFYAGSGTEQLYCFRTGTAGNVPASCTFTNAGTTSAYLVSTWTASPPTMVAGDVVRWAVADAVLCFTTEI